jgi:DNA-binding response OmpR family regulator
MVQVLVAEDEAAISLMLEDALVGGGFAVAGPFHRCSTTLEWLQVHTPDAALLDLRLADGLCIEVARLLRQRGVPILFFSGEVARLNLPDDLKDQPWLEKPASTLAILDAVHALAVLLPVG